MEMANFLDFYNCKISWKIQHFSEVIFSCLKFRILMADSKTFFGQIVRENEWEMFLTARPKV